jgi:hypothetical protein
MRKHRSDISKKRTEKREEKGKRKKYKVREKKGKRYVVFTKKFMLGSVSIYVLYYFFKS